MGTIPLGLILVMDHGIQVFNNIMTEWIHNIIQSIFILVHKDINFLKTSYWCYWLATSPEFYRLSPNGNIYIIYPK